MGLLKDALTCATPDAMFLRSRRRTRVASLPILDPFADRHRPHRRRHVSCSTLFLLPGNGFCRTLAGACIGMGALTAHRQTTAMAQTAVAPEIHQPLDVH